MPPFHVYKKMIGSRGSDGNSMLQDGIDILEQTWYDDPFSINAYIYDYYHDDEKLLYKGLHPEKSTTKTPIELKFITNSYNSEAKDQVGYHIQFKPSHECQLDYYREMFEEKYDAEYPIGLYLDIKDSKGIWRKWLVTENANYLDLQIKSWYILPCDHLFQWITDGCKYCMCGVSRAQNSYNSGEWTDHIFKSMENQRKCILPMNDISTTMFYNTRVAISAPIKTPTTWHCSKVEQTKPKGIFNITFAQSEWDASKDVFEYSDGVFTNEFYQDKKVVGIWCDYNLSAVTPVAPDDMQIYKIHSEITFSGIKAEIKVKGSYKKFTVKFYDLENNEVDLIQGQWKFEYKDRDGSIKDASSLVSTLTHTDSTDVKENQIKAKFIGDDAYIKDVLIVSYITDMNVTSSSVEMEILGL